jgi:type II protein arginine methyltransferase
MRTLFRPARCIDLIYFLFRYLVYEEAIFRALQDKLVALGTEQEGWEPVVMIVGAGRGGIVEAAMRAEERIGKKVRLYALDKNPHALVTMRTKQQFDGRWAQVHIVHSDMRAWQAPELCDILVSEMLGSFGDNELSPECLHGAERFMKPDGVSIPKWYKAYLAPLTSPRLYNAVAAIGQTSAWESPYVVRLHNVDVLSAEPQECWTFEHPEPQNRANCERQRAAAAAGGSGWIPPAALDPIDNSRHCSLKFRIPVSALVHGFGGYFDCCLYGEVHVSIHPQNHTPNMSSWFEIFFPLRDPIYVVADQDIELDVWRVCSLVKVWYEWAVSNPSPSHIHNPNGRSYWVGL